MPTPPPTAESQSLPMRIADVRRFRTSFETFYDKYDSLIALLCLAAREGISPEHERQYREIRSWFVRKYPAVKRRVSDYLESDGGDGYYKRSDRVVCDAFEALFMPGTIRSMFENDNGALIGRMMRTQTALGSWDDAIAHNESECRLQVAQSEFRRAALSVV